MENSKVLNESNESKEYLSKMPQQVINSISGFLTQFDTAALIASCKKMHPFYYYYKSDKEKLDAAIESLETAYELACGLVFTPSQTNKIIDKALSRIKNYIFYVKAQREQIKDIVNIVREEIHTEDKQDAKYSGSQIKMWKEEWKKRKSEINYGLEKPNHKSRRCNMS